MPPEGARLLIVDDDASNRLTLSALLEDEGYAVEIAESFDEGVAKIRGEAPYALVLLDLHLTVLSPAGEPSAFDLQHPGIGPIDRVDVRENKVRGRTVVELGAWTVVHLSPVEGGTGHLAVVCRVQEMPAPR